MTVLGKRKAPGPPVSQEAANDVFRRHFESRFAPLEASAPRDDVEPQDGAAGADDDDDESEWVGLSGDDDDGDSWQASPSVEVVDHSASQTPKAAAMTKRERKAFMSSRPPDQTDAANSPSTASPAASSAALPEDAPSLLAQDLELRRLLAESHLLSPAPAPSLGPNAAAEPRPFASGRTRQKATDLRIQALGAKASVLKQEKMPMSMRKGIVAAADARETKRRREAKENGVILEREVGKKKGRARPRERGVDRPGLGRLKGAELRLSERDVKRIEGGRDVFGRRGKR